MLLTEPYPTTNTRVTSRHKRRWGSATLSQSDFLFRCYSDPKIDYYDRQSFGTGHDCGSENPADPATTLRVLTVMLADEY